MYHYKQKILQMCGAAVGGQQAYDFVCMYRENSNIQSAVNRFGALHASTEPLFNML
jgi:hypothetical protein